MDDEFAVSMGVPVIANEGSIDLGRDSHHSLARAGDVKLESSPVLHPRIGVDVDIYLITGKVFPDVGAGEYALERDGKSARLVEVELPLRLSDVDFLVLHPLELLGRHAEIEH